MIKSWQLFFQKYQLIIGLAFLAGLIISYKILFPQHQINQKPQNSLNPTPTTWPKPTPTPIPFPTIDPSASYLPNQEIIEGLKKEQERAEKNYPLWKLLPYNTNDFIISHYTAPLTLVVKKKSSKKIDFLEKEVRNWIRKQGVDPQTHQIIWR